ncbi:MAG: glycerol-3-phosphate dehydrogenase subunit C [Gammaproteobacteria bacterium]|jgi:glycerol-3-phosphate dehydrogenase subunit C
MSEGKREGSLEAPTRHPLDWRNPAFYDETELFDELERVFDICHGCRRCFNLCNAFPTLFDLIDESETLEVDGVKKSDYWQVVDQCYLCDLCFMTKCPYVPPHEWNVDFPHLMLRAKATKAKQGKNKFRDKLLTSTDLVGGVASSPGVATIVNAVNSIPLARIVLESALGVHRNAWIPPYADPLLGHRDAPPANAAVLEAIGAGRTSGKVAIFETCYGRANERALADDMATILMHNGINVRRIAGERCCGMPKLELGDLEAVETLKRSNIPAMLELVDDGWDIMAPIPSCVLMFKQELPLMFPEDNDVERVRRSIFDPFEYLSIRHEAGLLNTKFKHSLGRIDYHVACHLRVQNMGLKTKDVLELVPDTRVDPIERCSGHDGTYAVKVEFHDNATKIARPIVNRVKAGVSNTYTSDCPMAGHHIAHGLGDGSDAEHPLRLLRRAYGI